MPSTSRWSSVDRSRSRICGERSIGWIRFWKIKMNHSRQARLWSLVFGLWFLFYCGWAFALFPVAAHKEPRSKTKDLFTEKGLEMAVQEGTKIRAPELTGDRGWLNTNKPLSLAALKGKVVLLDFWTYGCINCMHIIPDLKKLEKKYANQLVVIGVHSAKFENEKDTENIRRIILRYELEHPVYNDAEFTVWRSYGVRAWPTQVLIDPAGYVLGAVSGEGNYEIIDQVVSKTVDEFRKRGELNEQPLKL